MVAPVDLALVGSRSDCLPVALVHLLCRQSCTPQPIHAQRYAKESPPNAAARVWSSVLTLPIQSRCASSESMTVSKRTATSGNATLAVSPSPARPQASRNVTKRGSWNRSTPSGYSVVRVRFSGGEPVAFEDFLTGFLNSDGSAYFGRPVGLAVAPDGSLLVSDDSNGVIDRISYTQ